MSGKAYQTVDHGELRCSSKKRFWCVICHRLACWCTGVADQVDATLRATYTAPVPTGDPSICDECWSAHSPGDASVVALVVEVAA